MKFFGEWIPQSSTKRKIKGYIDGSSEMGFEDTIKYFQINKMERIKSGDLRSIAETSFGGDLWNIKIQQK